jgi:hypothetical protein
MVGRWKGSGRALFEVLALDMLGRKQENQDKPQSGYPISLPSFERIAALGPSLK